MALFYSCPSRAGGSAPAARAVTVTSFNGGWNAGPQSCGGTSRLPEGRWEGKNRVVACTNKPALALLSPSALCVAAGSTVIASALLRQESYVWITK